MNQSGWKLTTRKNLAKKLPKNFSRISQKTWRPVFRVSGNWWFQWTTRRIFRAMFTWNFLTKSMRQRVWIFWKCRNMKVVKFSACFAGKLRSCGYAVIKLHFVCFSIKIVYFQENSARTKCVVIFLVKSYMFFVVHLNDCYYKVE